MRSTKNGFGAVIIRMAGLAFVLSLAMSLSSPPTSAQAASAIVVDDDGVECPKRTHTTLAAALAAAPTNNAKITVCAGNYVTPALIINGKSNLKLTAKGEATVTPSGMPFTSHLLSVINSSKVTIEGFTFNGLGQVGTNTSYAAIYFNETSGTISKNTIAKWYGVGYPATRHGISIWINNSAGQAVTIDRNIMPNMDLHAIHMQGSQKVKVSGNTIGTNITGGSASAISATTGPTGTITKNIISSNALPGSGYIFYGIALYAVSGMKVTGNTVNGAYMGISVSGSPLNKNSISKNTLNETVYGIDLTVSSPGGLAQGNNNQITGNKIINTGVQGTRGIYVTANGDITFMFPAEALKTTVKGNTITKFAVGVQAGGGFMGTVTGVFDPNKWTP